MPPPLLQGVAHVPLLRQTLPEGQQVPLLQAWLVGQQLPLRQVPLLPQQVALL
jgi:hypothetical protein